MLRVTCTLLVLVMTIMCAFAFCILMKPFNIMSEQYISFHKFSSLCNTLILVLECSSCMFVSLLYSGSNVIGDQFYKRI